MDEEARFLFLSLGPRVAGGVGLDNQLSVVLGDCAELHKLFHVLSMLKVYKGVLGHVGGSLFGN